MQQFQVEIPKEPTRVWDLAVPIVQKDNKVYVRLTEDIMAPSIYDEVIFLLQMAEEGDIFEFTITTNGGSLDSAIALSNAIQTSKAHCKAVLVSTVASAGTVITLACDEVVVTPHLSFMCHTYSTVVGGKGNELESQQAFMKKYIENFTKEVYKNFLTPRELTKMLKGEDFWFTSEQVQERWERVLEARKGD